MTNKRFETGSFEYADRRINDLLSKLAAKGVCGCCTSRALMYNAASLAEDTVGSAKAAAMCEEITEVLRTNNVPEPNHEATH